MGQRVSDTIGIVASPDVILGIITDLEAYPDWIDDITHVEVLTRDDDGRPSEARFTASAAGMEADYSLAYAYAPNEVTWQLTQGELLSQLDGAYELSPTDSQVEVRYTLEGDVRVPMPGFMVKRIAKRILDEGLRGLKHRAEAA